MEFFNMSLKDKLFPAGSEGFFSLSDNVNKAKEGAEPLQEGVVTSNIPEISIDIDDDKLIAAAKAWKSSWDQHVSAVHLDRRRKRNEAYWLGKGFKSDLLDTTDIWDSVEHKPDEDNLIFEALETFLPEATRQNPEPVVNADDSEEGIKLAEDIQKMLVYQADIQRLRLKIKQATRYWAIGYVGCIKVGWSVVKNDIIIKAVRYDKLILDPDATIEEGWYTGDFIGEVKKEAASVLASRFPKMEPAIKKLVNGKMGSKVQYTEWWTSEGVLFWTLKGKILGKTANPNFNYDTEEIARKVDVPEDSQEGEVVEEWIDEASQEPMVKIKNSGRNHFPIPIMPYAFLSVFNLGLHPHDTTCLIEQNIPQQDRIVKRARQIDNNIDNMNNGWVVSLERAGLTKAQAANVVNSFRDGGVAVIPSGAPLEAINKINSGGLPADVFNDINDARAQLRGIFGVTGLSPQAQQKEQTVRGKIIIRQEDAGRISGGITSYIEQFADLVYNLMIQMVYVYYDEDHVAVVLDANGAQEYIKVANSRIKKKLSVSVKDGSLIPKDQLTKRNEAVELFGANAIDPITLYDRLGFPDPLGAAKRLVAWQNGTLIDGQPVPEGAAPEAAAVPGAGGFPVATPPAGPENLDAANNLPAVPR